MKMMFMMMMMMLMKMSFRKSSSDDDVVNGNVNEFDEKAYEAHDAESDGRRHGDLDELLPVGFCAALHQSGRVLGELLARLQLHQDGIHGWGWI